MPMSAVAAKIPTTPMRRFRVGISPGKLVFWNRNVRGRIWNMQEHHENLERQYSAQELSSLDWIWNSRELFGTLETPRHGRITTHSAARRLHGWIASSRYNTSCDIVKVGSVCSSYASDVPPAVVADSGPTALTEPLRMDHHCSWPEPKIA